MALVLAAPGLALGAPKENSAPDPTSVQYDSTASQVTGQTQTGGSEEGPLDGRVIGGLPFTGLDLLVMGAVAVTLTGTGIGLRVLSRPGEAFGGRETA